MLHSGLASHSRFGPRIQEVLRNRHRIPDRLQPSAKEVPGAQAPSRRYIVGFDAFSEYDAALPEESYHGVGSKGAERFLSARQTGGGLRIGRMWRDCPYSPFAHAFRLHRKVRGHDMRCLPNAKRSFPAKSGKGAEYIIVTLLK